jgi:indole-3-glycerol phosphate synthase
MLDEILANKRAELADSSANYDISQVRDFVSQNSRPSFRDVFDGEKPAIIAEIKYASPSHGSFSITQSPEEIALAYQENGAAAISVLTDKKYFDGSIENLKAAVNATSIPVLRKDFVIHESQIFEAAMAGASAVLLMVSCLSKEDLKRFISHCLTVNITPFVEVRTLAEAETALESGADTLGINNRNLDDLSVDINRSLDLVSHFSTVEDLVLVSESGIFGRSEIDLLFNAGFHGFLIGTSLMQSGSPGTQLSTLTGESR